MYNFEMPDFTINYEVNKPDPYPLLSKGMKEVVDFQLNNSKDAFDTNCSWDELRAKYVEERKFWNEGGPQPFKTLDLKVDGPIGDIPVRIYYPNDKQVHNAIVFIHGGGFTVGNIETHNRIMRCLMEASGCAVIGVDYHLAPEVKFPIPLYECAAVVRYFHEQGEQYGILPNNIGIAGDSGGANLALGTNLYLRDAFGGNEYVSALILYYGSFGVNDGPSWRTNGTVLDGMRKSDLEAYMSYYIKENTNDMENPYFATINNNLTYGVPPTYICCGDLDPLLGDSQALNSVLNYNGVRTQFEVVSGALHAFMHYGRMMDEAVTCLDESGKFFVSTIK